MTLLHFGVYLDTDDDDDKELIAILTKQAKKRRVGQYLRQALETHLMVKNGQVSHPPTIYAQPAPLRVTKPPSIDPPPVQVSVQPFLPPSNPAVSKLRNAFMGGR